MTVKNQVDLIVQDFLEYGGTTRIVQALAENESGIKKIILAGISADSSIIKNETGTALFHTFNVNFSTKLKFYISVFWGSLKYSFKLLNSYKIRKIYLNLPYSALPFYLNPYYKKTKKIFIFHGAWDLEQFVSGSTQMPSVNKPFYKTLPLGLKKFKFAVHYYVNRYCLLKSDNVFVFSKYSKGLASGYFKIPPSKIIIKKAPFQKLKEIKLTRDELTKFKFKYGIGKNTNCFLVPSRIEPRKGIHILLEAVDYLVKGGNTDFKVLLTGPVGLSESYVFDLFKYCREKGIFPYIVFANSLKRKSELVKAYKASECVIVPSVGFETFGLITLESLSMGTPVIGFKSGATPELLSFFDKRFIVDKINSYELYKKMKWFINLGKNTKAEIAKKAESAFVKILTSNKDEY